MIVTLKNAQSGWLVRYALPVLLISAGWPLWAGPPH